MTIGLTKGVSLHNVTMHNVILANQILMTELFVYRSLRAHAWLMFKCSVGTLIDKVTEETVADP